MRETLEKIQTMLCSFYNIPLDIDCCDFLLTVNDDEEISQMKKISTELKNQRAATLFKVCQQSETLDIMLYFSRNIREKLKSDPPLERLHSGNLDTFCVFVEEVSHFLFVADHFNREQPFSLLELEWQGEIDRFLISSLLMKEQFGHSHHGALLKTFRENYEFLPQDSHTKQRYSEAHHLATKFLEKLIAPNYDFSSLSSRHTQSRLQEVYRAHWEMKLKLANVS